MNKAQQNKCLFCGHGEGLVDFKDLRCCSECPDELRTAYIPGNTDVVLIEALQREVRDVTDPLAESKTIQIPTGRYQVMPRPEFDSTFRTAETKTRDTSAQGGIGLDTETKLKNIAVAQELKNRRHYPSNLKVIMIDKAVYEDLLKGEIKNLL
jgi:hypothetical protein